MPWRHYVNIENPVATALMAKMQIAPRDRPKVKVQCLRVLATLRLDPAKSGLIGAFIENYLRLNANEIKQYQQELAKLPVAEKEATMKLMTSWEQKGIEEGLRQGLEQGLEQGLQQGLGQGTRAGKEDIVSRQLRRRFGELPVETTHRLDQLTSEQLGDLGEAVLDFTGLADLDRWLAQNRPS
jgi:flagellar biosynthesis/type III secretory pathway protein FliH